MTAEARKPGSQEASSRWDGPRYLSIRPEGRNLPSADGGEIFLPNNASLRFGSSAAPWRECRKPPPLLAGEAGPAHCCLHHPG